MGEPAKKTSLGLDENVESLLCYLFWWITGIIFFVLEKDSKAVKFHAMQSIITFGAVTVVSIVCSVLGFIPYLGLIFRIVGGLVWLLGVIVWIVLMIKAYKGEQYKLPFFGDIAEKQINK